MTQQPKPSSKPHSKSLAEVLDLHGFDGETFQPTDGAGKSYRGGCPNCGGYRRMLLWVDRGYPNFNHRCDFCGFGANSLVAKPDIKEIDLQVSIRQADPKIKQAKLEELVTGGEWLLDHQRMTAENIKWWEERGITPYWQSIWLLGYTPLKHYQFRGEKFTAPAYTIPKFGLDDKIRNVDFRLAGAPPEHGKYRQIFSLDRCEFIANPSLPQHDELFVVEGSIKAMVLYSFLQEHHHAGQVIGIPGIEYDDWKGWSENFKRVWLILDPDGYKRTAKISRQWRNFKPVYYPEKIDDAIVQKWLNYSNFKDLLIWS